MNLCWFLVLNAAHEKCINNPGTNKKKLFLFVLFSVFCFNFVLSSLPSSPSSSSVQPYIRQSRLFTQSIDGRPHHHHCQPSYPPTPRTPPRDVFKPNFPVSNLLKMRRQICLNDRLGQNEMWWWRYRNVLNGVESQAKSTGIIYVCVYVCYGAARRKNFLFRNVYRSVEKAIMSICDFILHLV